MSLWEAIVLGLIQGLTEFLPVSSSGHLVLGQYFLGIQEQGIIFEVFVHLGTTLAILTVYRQRVLALIGDGIAGLKKPGLYVEALKSGEIEKKPGDDDILPSLRLIVYVAITMIPTGLAYIFFKDQLEASFNDPRLVCIMLLVTGTLLILLKLRPNPFGKLAIPKAVMIGVAQACALIPGISRSGATICASIYQNVDRKDAADFSFLMLIPVIVGATLVKTLEMFGSGETISFFPVLVGTIVAYFSGIWAIRVVLNFVQRGNLYYFAFYCYLIGILGLVLINP